MQADASRRIEFPLHPLTVSEAQVGKLLEVVLEAITQQVDAHAKVSDGDLLQSLCMALAIRMHMADAPAAAARNLVATALDQADTAVADSLLQIEGKA
jgi:hypothetical protein